VFTSPGIAGRGFELDALDYLLKPFPLSRFSSIVKKPQEWQGFATQRKENGILIHQKPLKAHNPSEFQ